MPLTSYVEGDGGGAALEHWWPLEAGVSGRVSAAGEGGVQALPRGYYGNGRL